MNSLYTIRPETVSEYLQEFLMYGIIKEKDGQFWLLAQIREHEIGSATYRSGVKTSISYSLLILFLYASKSVQS